MVNFSAYILRFIVLLTFIPGVFRSQVQPKYPSLLWKISGKNLRKPSYLYGTMHVSNRVAYYLSEQFFEALKSVDVIGLETNPGEWLENMELTGALDEANQLRGQSFNGNFYKNTFVANYPEKKILQGILSYDPDIINGLLYRNNGGRDNFEESTYIDLFIFQSASKLNKKVISLENFANSEIKARLAMLPDEEPENQATYYATAQSIEDAYRLGNLDLLDSLSKMNSTRNTQRFLIEDRNVFFVNTIDSVLQTSTLFSGVGAAHLPGEQGVIQLLRKKGYTVEPVFPEVTRKSNAYREQLDQKVKPVEFQKRFIPDSLFSVSLPGKLYPIVDLGNLKYYINADMVNGSFYTIVRLKHQGSALGLKAQDMLLRVDSLLFESIPGKIVERKEIVSNTGVRGLDVLNRTRRGDEQHYQIFFTDLEMIVFKLGGKHQYASGPEAKKFFGSINFLQTTGPAFLFTPPTKGFSVKIPRNYHYYKNNGSSLMGLVENLFAYNTTNNELTGVQQAVYNDFAYLESDTFELNRLASAILTNYHYTISPTYKITKEQGFPCIYLNGNNAKKESLYGKVFIKGVHYYYVYVISPKTASFDHEIFKTFQLTDFNYVHQIKEITDNDFYFKAKDEVSDNALSRFNEDYVKAYEAIKTKKDSARSDFDFRSGNKFYYSPSSNEYINITYEKYNDYDYKDEKELKNKIEKAYRESYSMVPVVRESKFEKGSYTYRATLTDTGTVRALELKLYMRNGLMLEVIAPVDTTIGLKGWAGDFFESFTPKDTVIGRSVFENKFGALLNDLASADTAVKRKANVSLLVVGMQKAYKDEFVKFISGPKINQISEDSRAQLFVNGGTLESDAIIAPYRSLYKQYTDSFYLQLCLLKGLAYRKTQISYNTFYELLMSEVPLVGAENTTNDVFEVLHDSLELCKKFFPGILSLTRYEEYKDAVYALMASMVDKKILLPSDYTAQKAGILMDADLTLKRYNPQTAKDLSYEQSEKYSKEFAENIKNNLNSLAANNMYKGTRYLKELDSYNRPPLVNYAILLSSSYKIDEKVKQFFTRLSRIKSQSVMMPVMIQLLKENVTWIDTLATFYSRNKYTRAFFYTELEKAKLTDKFDKKYLDQQSLIESVLLSYRQLNNLYTSEKDKSKKDSLILIKELSVANKYRKGTMYIYKYSGQKPAEEQWGIAFVPESKEPVNSTIELVSASYYIDNTKTQQDNVNDLLSYFSLEFHKRAQNMQETYE